MSERFLFLGLFQIFLSLDQHERCIVASERVKADNGYAGEPDHVATAVDDNDIYEWHTMKGAARTRHETINGWFKKWSILRNFFRHPLKCHANAFLAIAIINYYTSSN